MRLIPTVGEYLPLIMGAFLAAALLSLGLPGRKAVQPAMA